MERKAILKKVHDETDKTDIKLLVPKIVYGIDKRDNLFIYFKMKCFKSNSFEKDSFVIMYQNPKHNEEYVSARQKFIIDWFKKEYDAGKEREFGSGDGLYSVDSKRHFFIKGKVFKTRKKIDKFYLNSIRRLILELEPKTLIAGIKDFADGRFTEEPGLLNYVISESHDKT